MKSLKDLLPEIEANWLLPAWLLIAVISAFVAELIIIGTGVETIYSLWVGWPIGLTIASTQAIGSMMYSNAMSHNSRRKIVTKKGKVGESARVENVLRSEPKLSSGLPFTISVLAGVSSAIVGLALYSADGGLDFLDFTLAIVSPFGSIAAALLNGVFASGELAIRKWQIGEGIIVIKDHGEPKIEVDVPQIAEAVEQIAYDDWMALQTQKLATNGGSGFSANEMVEQFGMKQRTAYNWLTKYQENSQS